MYSKNVRSYFSHPFSPTKQSSYEGKNLNYAEHYDKHSTNFKLQRSFLLIPDFGHFPNKLSSASTSLVHEYSNLVSQVSLVRPICKDLKHYKVLPLKILVPVKSLLKQEKTRRTAAAPFMKQIPHREFKNRSLTLYLHMLTKIQDLSAYQ